LTLALDSDPLIHDQEDGNYVESEKLEAMITKLLQVGSPGQGLFEHYFQRDCEVGHSRKVRYLSVTGEFTPPPGQSPALIKS